MQDFYARLFPAGEASDPQAFDPQMKKLSQLTEATLTHMKALEITLGWDAWGVKAIEAT